MPSAATEDLPGVDPRIDAGVAWCTAHGLHDLTVAIPFELPPDSLAPLLDHPAVAGLVLAHTATEPGRPAGLPGAVPQRLGAFLFADYSWRLPAAGGRDVLFIGERGRLTARMIRQLLQRRIRGIVYWDIDAWRRCNSFSLALGKVVSKGGEALRWAEIKLLTHAHRAQQQVLQLLLGAIRRLPVGAGFTALTRTLDRAFAAGSKRLTRALDRALAASQLPAQAAVAELRAHEVALLEAVYRRRFQRLLGPSTADLRLPTPSVPGPILIACPTLTAGGAERQIVNTVLGLRRCGLDRITVLVANLHGSPGNDFFYSTLIAAGIDVREPTGPTDSVEAWQRYQDPALESLTQRLHTELRHLPAGLAQEIANLYIEIQALRPAVLHAWLDYSSTSAGLAALLAGVPRVLVSGRNVSPVHFPYIHQLHHRPAYRAMAQRPETIFVNNSQGGAADYAAWLGLPPGRFRIIYNGVDTAGNTPVAPEAIAAFRRQHGIPAQARLVGGMFRFSDEKQPLLWVDTLAQVCAREPSACGLLFGAGPLHGEIATRIEQAGLAAQVRVLPPTPAAALALSAFDVLLLTSRWEGTPNVAIEAQALGTAVVLCGGGGAAEALQQGETGLYVDQPDPAALAAAVLRVLADVGLRERLAAAATTFVAERFGIERMISETLDAYGFGPPAAASVHPAPTELAR